MDSANVKYSCVFCRKEVEEYIPDYCCDGRMCGCYGEPLEPPMHIECYNKHFGFEDD